ncbi:MAG: TatD family hydrolase [Bacteroidales bacterium]|jgi:TatD DNase family protein|nr:TatD family hydrolase [Bacteroidales bacterium]MDY0085262.1 TatD family hydrolase [Bacteroidales bacterium]
MQFIDTHTHLYLEDFDHDRQEMIKRAISRGIHRFLLPNIDQDSVKPLLQLCEDFPANCFPMIGLHPTSVKEDWQKQLSHFKEQLKNHPETFIAIGEIGLDFYWDKSFATQQLEALRMQFDWAKQMQKPVAIHTREAFPEMLTEIQKAQNGSLKGVLHCFTGTLEEAKKSVDLGFYLGIGGVLTYKKSSLPEIVKHLPVERLILETDAPFLPPVPYRGKRNESAYLFETAVKLAAILEIELDKLAEITTQNANELFNLPTK